MVRDGGEKEGSRGLPVPGGSPGGDAKDVGGIDRGESGEEAEFDQSGLAAAVSLQTLQGCVEVQEFQGGVVGSEWVESAREALHGVPFRAPMPLLVDQVPPHHPRADQDQRAVIQPGYEKRPAKEAEEAVMEQVGGPTGATVMFAVHEARGKVMKALIQSGHSGRTIVWSGCTCRIGGAPFPRHHVFSGIHGSRSAWGPLLLAGVALNAWPDLMAVR